MSNDATDHPKTLGIKEILKILPHRYPFLLVDKITDMDLKNGIIKGVKNLTMNEYFFQGHSPEAPIMPGVLIIEALAQTGAVLVHHKGVINKIAVLLAVRNAKFRKPVNPGDVLQLRCEGLHLSSKGGKIQAIALVNDKIVAQAEITFALVDKDQI